MIIHRPKIRFENDGSSPIEAALEYDGRIRLKTDPDDGRLTGAWMSTKDVRSFALELLGMCDVSDALNDDGYRHTDANLTCPGPGIKCVCWDLSAPCELVCTNLSHGRSDYKASATC